MCPASGVRCYESNLEKEFMAAEVKEALFEMAPSKALGVDGFTAGFNQRHWDVVGEDVTAVVLGFLNGEELPLGLNDTAITLIPKVEIPRRSPSTSHMLYARFCIRLQ